MAIDTIAGIIGVKAKQFSADPRLSDLIEIAKLQTSSCFGDKYNLAVALRVCHWLALEARNGGDGGSSTSGSGTSGVLKSEKEGDLARSYEIGKFGENSDLASTTFGQELLSLIRQSFLYARTRLMSGCDGEIIS